MNELEGGPDYRFGTPQYTAIHEDISNAYQNPDIYHIFAIFHKPAHSNGYKHGCGGNDIDDVIEGPDISVDLGELFQTYDVDIVFSGHEHNYERFQPVLSDHEQMAICEPPGDPEDPDHLCNIINEGTTYVVNGGGGGNLSDVEPAGTTEDCPDSFPGCDLPSPPLESIIAEKTYHAVFVKVNGPIVNVEVQDMGGSVIDQFIIDKEISIKPLTHTLTIPTSTTVPQGGLLGPFHASATNNTSSSYSFYVYPYIGTPDGSWRLIFTNFITLAAGQTSFANNGNDIYIKIPRFAMIGTTYHCVNVFDASYNLIDNDCFSFDVTPASSKAQLFGDLQRFKKIMNTPGARIENGGGYKMITVPK